MPCVVVYVHGLWLWGGESFLLCRRLAASLGSECRVFAYPSVTATVQENARALSGYLHAVKAEQLHLIGHSMGGALILRMFESGLAADLPPGRVVFSGSPVRGSRSAKRLAALPGGRRLLGVTAAQLLLPPLEPRWPGGREVGVIAGDLAVGLGRLLGRVDGDSDGTVWVSETDLPGATDQIRLPVSHSGMVFSPIVARQTAAFLRSGRFLRS